MAFGWLALYQMQPWGGPPYAVNYFGRVANITWALRRELLPEEPNHPRANEEYYKLWLDSLLPMPNPIISRRQRFIVFISTTLDRFWGAREINDLFCISPLEEHLWQRLQAEHIEAERQWYLKLLKRTYCLDFAVFCAKGKVDIECDGGRWHTHPYYRTQDKARDEALTASGWAVLRFNTTQIANDLPSCIMQVRDVVSRYGGVVTAESQHRWLATN